MRKENPAEKELLRAYDKHADAIYRHCLYRVFNRETAEDLTQEIFLRLFEYLSEGNEIKYIKSFLYRTANNLIIDGVRKKKEASLESMMQNGFNPTNNEQRGIALSAEASMAMDVIEKIEEEYRTPLLMRYVDGLAPKEIARILGESQNVVSVRIYRGLKKIKRILE